MQLTLRRRTLRCLGMLVIGFSPVASGQAGSAGLPAGIVMAFAGDAAAIPNGWLLCDGRAVDRTQYAALFAVLGTAHGPGDGARTFNLPDYRGYFLRGVDGGAGNDPDVASRVPLGPGATPQSVGSSQGDATRQPNAAFAAVGGPHNHAYKDWDASNSKATQAELVERFEASRGEGLYRVSRNRATEPGGDQHKHEVTGGDRETRPKNKAVHWIIRF